MLPALALLLVAQDRTDTKGKTDAQILAMGRKRWHAFYVGRDLGVTPAEAGAEGTYGDALAARNARLLKGHASPLGEAMGAFAKDAVGVGSALTGGGTIWNITGASLYADTQEALYRVLTHAGGAPPRKTSDVEKPVAALRRKVAAIGSDRPYDRRQGTEAVTRLAGDLRRIVALAARLPRRESDTVLEFVRSTAVGVVEDTTPQ